MIVFTTATTAITIDKIEERLNYILKHFDGSQYPFPRNIMTRKLNGQIEALDKETALREFELSNWRDCRINAYPKFTNYKAINFIAPSIVFIDLDLQYVKSQEVLDRALRDTLRLMQKTVSSGIKVKPTVLWTGNGYHVYLPIDGLVLEEESVFTEFIDNSNSLTTKFMRFAEQYFAKNKQDPNHNPSVNNCLLRIPGTYNSKNGQQIILMQKWNGYRIPIQYMLRNFRRYLIQEKLDEVNDRNKKRYKPSNNTSSHTIGWIESLLQTSLPDNRKYCIWRVLAPYLVNVRKLSDEESISIIRGWLEKCNSIKCLSFDPKDILKYNIRKSRRIGYYPISWNALRTENLYVYQRLTVRKSVPGYEGST